MLHLAFGQTLKMLGAICTVYKTMTGEGQNLRFSVFFSFNNVNTNQLSFTVRCDMRTEQICYKQHEDEAYVLILQVVKTYSLLFFVTACPENQHAHIRGCTWGMHLIVEMTFKTMYLTYLSVNISNRKVFVFIIYRRFSLDYNLGKCFHFFQLFWWVRAEYQKGH